MRYTVEVLQDDPEAEPSIWDVEADSERDAKTIAFLLDGGWNPEERNTEGLHELAATYAAIK